MNILFAGPTTRIQMRVRNLRSLVQVLRVTRIVMRVTDLVGICLHYPTSNMLCPSEMERVCCPSEKPTEARSWRILDESHLIAPNHCT